MLSQSVPTFMMKRSLWVLPALLWAVVVGGSLHSHFADIDQQSRKIAVEGARDMFRMVVLTRAWNAEHGGVYLPVSEKIQPNPYLQHPLRDLVTTNGMHLTMINPAYMTRLLSEMAQAQNGATFHITSLKPIRPGNAPDAWERKWLHDFENGTQEAIEVVPAEVGQPAQLRYMAPLKTLPSCLACHANQGYRAGDIRGGISVSLPFAPIAAAASETRYQSALSHLLIFGLGLVVGLILLEQLRRRWMRLGETICELESARNELDASNQKLSAAKDASEVANLAKSRFLANMSHELRTPLNAVTGFAHLLKRSLADPKQVDDVEQIQRASARLLEMINQMLSLAQADTGELEVVNEAFDVGKLANELFSELLEQVAGRPLAAALELEPAAMDCRLRGDRRHITEIARHYLSNAVKFSETGEITLAIGLFPASNGQRRLRLAVRDQGIGIGAEHLPDLFALFHQVDSSLTRRHGGNGIGLILCKRLADLMGGEVGVVSEVGRGSEFWLEVTLPEA